MENCNNYQERISAFIDGLLTEAERLELMEHMANCPACQAYFDDQMAIHDAMTGLEADAPAGFAEAVMARVQETTQDAPAKKVITFPHWRRWAATAACCAIAVLGVMGLQDRDLRGSAPAAQDVVSYTMPRSQSESDTVNTTAAEETIQTDSKPVENIVPCALEDSDAPAAAPTAPELARTEEAETKNAAAVSCALTTASPVAKQWVEEQLDQLWQAGSSYELTAEQFDELRQLLENASEPYTVATAENGGFLLLAVA